MPASQPKPYDDVEYPKWVTNIARQELYIDAMNPPRNTGLLPLTLSDPIVDAARLQAIFDYIKANEYSFQPDGNQYTGFTYTVKLPKCLLTLGAKVTLRGQYLTILGDGTFIKTTHSDPAFESTGSDARKLTMEGVHFSNVVTAINMVNSNIDTGMLNFERCFFFATTGVAVKIDDRSAMAVFRRCSFYHCRFIFESVLLDQTVFDNCWFSEQPMLNNYETSFTLRGTYTKFRECFFIPNGKVTSEASLTDLAWIASYASVEIDDCRVSSEPNSKTLVNNYAAPVSNPYNITMVKVTNCYRLSAQLGECIVRLFDVPNKVDISNNGMVRNDDVPIKYGTGFNINDWLTANPNFTNTKIEVIIRDNMGQNVNNSLCPPDLLRFTRPSDSSMIVKENDLTSARTGTFSNTTPYFDITSSLKTSSGQTFPTKMFLVKLEARPSNGQVNYRSFWMGYVSFTVGSYGGLLKAKVILTPLLATQGGSVTDQGSPVTVTAVFTDTGTDTTEIVSGSTTNYGVRITWTSAIDSTSGKYTYKEVMDGAFLF